MRYAGTARPTRLLLVANSCANFGISGATMNACTNMRNAAAQSSGSIQGDTDPSGRPLGVWGLRPRGRIRGSAAAISITDVPFSR
jgi:hypothetical protein